MTEELKELKQTMASLQSTIAAQDGELTTLKQSISGLQAEIDLLSGELTVLKYERTEK